MAVDIILSTNRLSPFLDEALDSVVAQTYTHWRLVIIDDGSPSPESLDAVTARIPGTLVLHQPARGVSAGRNAGLAAADAAFVTFLDDDDIWHPERLDVLLDTLGSNSTAVGAYSAGWHIDGAGNPIGVPWTAARTAREDLLRGAVPLPRIITLLLKTDAARSIEGFDETLAFSEDDEYVLRVLQHGALVGDPRELVGYRRHVANTTLAPWPVRRSCHVRAITSASATARRRGDTATVALLDENLRRFYERSGEGAIGHAIGAIRGGDWRLAGYTMAVALRDSPKAVLKGTRRRVAGKLGHPFRR